MLSIINWFKSSLFRKLLTIILALNILLYFVFANIMFSRIWDTIEVGTRETLTIQSDNVADSIDSYFFGKSDIAKMISLNPIVIDFLQQNPTREEFDGSENYLQIVKLLDTVFDIDTDIGQVWISNPTRSYNVYSDGSLSDVSYDVTTRPWYLPSSSITNKNQVWFSSLAESFYDKQQTAMIVKPIFGEAGIIGYIGMNVYIDSFPEIIDKLSDIDGNCLIVGVDGNVIYSQVEWHLGKNISELGYIDNSVTSDILSGKSNFITTKVGNKNYYLSYNGIPLTGWTVGIYLDASVVTNQMFGFNLLYFISVACIIIFICVAIYIVLRKSTKQIPDIVTALERISEGDYSVRINAQSSDEISQIAGAIDELCIDLDEKSKIIQSYAHFDLLTGLPNRKSLLESLDVHVENARTNMTKLAVCCIDLDDFKWVNDTLGHSFGDELLLRFSEIITQFKHPTDIASRFGGDEFMIIMPNIEDESSPSELLSHIKDELLKPMSVLGHELYLRFTAGISLYPNDALTPDELIKNCDMAMYNAKSHGKNRFEYYDSSLQHSMTKTAKINQALSEALSKNEFSLVYQPIVDAKDRTVHSVEVLVRWTNDELGSIPPSEFIPIAEDTGLIVPIGTWILEQSCITQKKLSKVYGRDIILSVNISPEQMKQKNFIELVKDIIIRTGINPKHLQLEITESLLIDCTQNANDILTKICNLGVKIALDDFGTGYSSLSYLKHFPIHVLKIDKSFIDEIVRNKKDYAITSSVINLVHNLGIVTIAEGVETTEQYGYLMEMDCEYIQGYLMSKPLPENMIIDYLKKLKDKNM